MQRPRLLYDGLWRCLCPSFDKYALQKALKASTSPPRPHVQLRGRAATRTPVCSQRRQYGTETFTGSDFGYPPHSQEPTNSFLPVRFGGKPLDDILLAPTPPTPEQLDLVTATELVDALRCLRNPAEYYRRDQDLTLYHVRGQDVDRHQRIVQLVTELLAKHNYPLSLFIYECMMDAMIDPQGSVPGIRALLRDMERQEIQPNSIICHSALAALAVHPDYVLRQQVLDIMQEHWFTIDNVARQHVLLGLLRDGQHELAYERLTKMLEEQIQVDNWVYDIFILLFGRLAHVDEMLQLLVQLWQARSSRDAAVLNLTYYALDVCSGALHHRGTLWAWNASVRNGLLRPSDGILENVLATASRKGDVELATEVHEMIAAQGKVHAHHYEALVEAFANNDNLAGAVRILCIMDQNGIHVGKDNTRPIYVLLRKKPHLVDNAEKMLRSTAAGGPAPYPYAVLAVFIEAIAQAQGSEAAMSLYQDIELLTGNTVPSAATIQDMILHSTEKDTRGVLVSDYKGKVPADEPAPERQAWISSKLVDMMLEMDEYALAMRIAVGHFERHASKKDPIPWLKPLAEKAMDAEDRMIWDILDTLRRANNQDALDIIKRVARAKSIAMKVKEMKKA